MASNAMYDAERAASSPSALYEFMLRNSQPSVDERVARWTGMQPGMDRSTFLPRYDRKLGWIAPNLLYQMARAAVSPGVAMHGGYVSPEDAVNFAGNVSADALIASAAMKNPAPGPGKTLPMTVYHGSPHSFDAFDMSKIGTGEGAQAYGHGLYVAENPGVAKSYAVVPKGQKQLTIRDAAGKILAQGDSITDPQLQAAGALDGSLSRMSDEAKTILSEWKSRGAKTSYEAVRPTLYTVDLADEHIARMLDWDKPLSQQPANVQAAFKRRITEPKAIDGMDMGGNARLRDNRNRQADPSQVQPWVLETQSANGTSRFGLSQKDVDRLIGGQDVSQLTGAQIYQRMAAEHGGFPQASEMMKNLGVPGIKYLDGGSRGAGEGTRNYVVFSDKILKILKKE